jgi:hypothetical protein
MIETTGSQLPQPVILSPLQSVEEDPEEQLEDVLSIKQERTESQSSLSIWLIM